MAFPITLKPLRGQVFKVTSEAGDTIRDLKRKVAEQRSEFPEALQQLMYMGRNLRDDEFVLNLGLTPNQFVVVVLIKAKPRQKLMVKDAATKQTPVSCPTEPAVVPTVAEPALSPLATPVVVSHSARWCPTWPSGAVMEEVPQSAKGSPLTPPAAQPVAPPVAPVVVPLDVQVAGRVKPPVTKRASQPPPPLFADWRSRRRLSDGNWDKLLASNPELLVEMLPEIEAQDLEMAKAIRSDPLAFLAVFECNDGGRI